MVVETSAWPIHSCTRRMVGDLARDPVLGRDRGDGTAPPGTASASSAVPAGRSAGTVAAPTEAAGRVHALTVGTASKARTRSSTRIGLEM
jgi:hypothetical protein